MKKTFEEWDRESKLITKQEYLRIKNSGIRGRHPSNAPIESIPIPQEIFDRARSEAMYGYNLSLVKVLSVENDGEKKRYWTENFYASTDSHYRTGSFIREYLI